MKPKRGLSFGKKWLLVTLIIFFIATFYFSSVLGESVFVFLFFVPAYFLLCIILFRKRLIGELGVYFHMRGDYFRARDLVELSVKRGGKSVGALNLYGIYLLKEGRADEALDSLSEAKRLNRSRLMDKHLTVSIASCYWILGNVPKGIHTIEELIKLYGTLNADAYTTLGFMYILQRDYIDAIKYTNMALEQDPRSAAAFDNLGQIHYRKGQKQQAEERFLEALEINPSMVDSLYYMGLLSDEKGNTEDAQKYFLRAKECGVNALNTVTMAQIDEKIKTV